MAKFIELPLKNGVKVLVNCDWIEEVRPNDELTCTVYMAFMAPTACEQDYYHVDLPFEIVAALLTEPH